MKKTSLVKATACKCLSEIFCLDVLQVLTLKFTLLQIDFEYMGPEDISNVCLLNDSN